MSSRRIGIAGFGFSGLMLAAQLVRRAATGTTLYLVDPSLQARGLAYSTPYAEHLLNVRAGNMSAWADAPTHFVEWLATAHPAYSAQDFVPRQIYGEYLQAIWQQVQEEASARHVMLKLVPSVAVAVQRDSDALTLRTERGDAIAIDEAVLTTGNEMKPMPAPVDAPMLQDPWAEAALAEAAKSSGPILLLGTGLTAVDIVLALRAEGYAGQLLALSRNGLWPQPHRDGITPQRIDTHDVAGLRNLADWMAWLRREVRRAADWRSVVDGLRPHTQRAWAALPAAAQQAFLRRLLSFWNVHRHRMAPQIGAAIAEEQLRGTLKRVSRRELASAAPSLIINCTGPELDVRRSRRPLMKQLVADGLIEPHSTGLGIGADARQRAWGQAHPHLYAVGALLTGQLLESTAVPELREQAQQVAEALCRP